jgi:hypothetical protein
VFPPDLGPTPVEGMEITKPCRCSGGVQPRELGTVALSALLVAAPFVDRRDERRWRKRPVALASPLRSCWRSSCSQETSTTSVVEHQ